MIYKWFPWNGSKKWLINQLKSVIKNWDGKENYIDPFVGGGSISALTRYLFPVTKQYLSDTNPWLVAAFKSQLIDSYKISDNYTDINYWRNLKDSDIEHLSILEQANRFAICLFTAWGNRWKSKPDGSMGSENPINIKFTDSVYLKKKLDTFFSIKWLNSNDDIKCIDWKETIKFAKEGDLVYIDPPYPESLGYGNQWWSFSDQLDIVDYVSDAVKRKINIVVSNMATIERLYQRVGLNTMIIDGPKVSKTRINRQELIAWKIY